MLCGNGGVDAARVELQVMELVGRKGGDGAVCGGTKLKGSLNAIVVEEPVSENLCELAGGVPAKDIHLKQTVLRGDEALGNNEVVKGGGAYMGYAVGVALYRNRR